jgi:hypothetical protein
MEIESGCPDRSSSRIIVPEPADCQRIACQQRENP